MAVPAAAPALSTTTASAPGESAPGESAPEAGAADAGQRDLDSLVRALDGNGEQEREPVLLELRARFGTRGLVAALRSSATLEDRETWLHNHRIFALITGSNGDFGLNDPRGGDALAAFIATGPHLYWKLRSAVAQANIGDLRAVPVLAERLGISPLKLYSDATPHELELKRDDAERVEAARMLADLADLHPEALALLRQQGEDALLHWLLETPFPHANGIRALAKMRSPKLLPHLRRWAFPKLPLPAPGAPPPMPEEWILAQVALRHLGTYHHDPSFSPVLAVLRQRPKDIDVSMDSLMRGGLALLGMSVRAIGIGAAQGLAEWEDARAFSPLMRHIEDTQNNEQSREAACEALPWVAPKRDYALILARLERHRAQGRQEDFTRHCLALALSQRPARPEVAQAVVSELELHPDRATAAQLAHALARTGLSADLEARLSHLLPVESTRSAAIIALLLGATSQSAIRALTLYATLYPDPALFDELRDAYYAVFQQWSQEDLERGVLFRWVRNAEALARVELFGASQHWATGLLAQGLQSLDFDSGPHSLTRPVARGRLYEQAKDPAHATDAIRLLRWMKEHGALIALSHEPGEIGALAAAALEEAFPFPSHGP